MTWHFSGPSPAPALQYHPELRSQQRKHRKCKMVHFKYLYFENIITLQEYEDSNTGPERRDFIDNSDTEDDEEDEDEDEDIYLVTTGEDDEDEECYDDTCGEEMYPGVRNVGLLGKVARTLSYFTPGSRNTY